MENNDRYILNPVYSIRADKKRAILFSNNSWYPLPPEYSDLFRGFLHPLLAIILSFFDGEDELTETVEKIARLLNLKNTEILNLISPLLENQEELKITYDGESFFFPKKLLIKKTANDSLPKIDMKQFLIPKNEFDFKSWRMYIPLNILFMINTRCATDCIYCYADRKKSMDLGIP